MKAEKEKEKEKAEKEKKAFESQFAVLESEKTASTKVVEEAKAARDKAIAMVNSLKYEQERLVQMAKDEADEKIAKAMSEWDEAKKAFEDERIDQKVREETIREEAKQEAIGDIVKYGMTFRRSALFLIREKYPNLDFFDINFLDMRGHDIQDLDDGGLFRWKELKGFRNRFRGKGF